MFRGHEHQMQDPTFPRLRPEVRNRRRSGGFGLSTTSFGLNRVKCRADELRIGDIFRLHGACSNWLGKRPYKRSRQ
jgi:hypothetical protein